MSNIRVSPPRILTLVWLALAVLLGQQPAHPLLDLTRPDPRPERTTGSSSGGGVGGSNTRFVDPPLRITLEGVEPGEHAFGSRLIYEVVLENTSGSGFVIPWGGVPERAMILPDGGGSRRPDGYRNGALVLTREAADGQNEWIGSVSIIGAPAIPETVRTLSPGERVSIRAFADPHPSSLGIQGFAAPPRTTVRLRASLNLFENPENIHYRPVLSSNSVEITLVPPEPEP